MDEFTYRCSKPKTASDYRKSLTHGQAGRIDDGDWRLQDQEDYLHGRSLRLTKWWTDKPAWDHDAPPPTSTASPTAPGQSATTAILLATR